MTNKNTMAEAQENIKRLYCRKNYRKTIARMNSSIITTLPRELLFNILSRLHTKTIFRCRSVCKTLRNIISDPEFGNLHFKRSSKSTDREIMIRPDGPGSLSRTLFLLDLEKLKPYAEFLLPLNDEIACSGFDVMNSCNGLICLCRFFDKNPVLVCNPITKEYINIPRNRPISRLNSIECECSLCLDYDKIESESEIVASGFGYSPKSNQYKVIKIFNPRIYSHGSKGFEIGLYVRSAEVYILGNGSWRSTKFAPQTTHSLLFATYLKETINWVCANNGKFDFIISFDFDDEQFQIVSPPPCFGSHKKDADHIRMQELGGCLSVCDSSNSFKCLDIWLMKNFSGKRLWSKAFSISMWCGNLIEPVKFVNDGEVMLMVHDSKTLVSYSQLYKQLRNYKIRGVQSHFGAFCHIPNFLSLKEIVKGDHQEEILIVKWG